MGRVPIYISEHSRFESRDLPIEKPDIIGPIIQAVEQGLCPHCSQEIDIDNEGNGICKKCRWDTKNNLYLKNNVKNLINEKKIRDQLENIRFFIADLKRKDILALIDEYGRIGNFSDKTKEETIKSIDKWKYYSKHMVIVSLIKISILNSDNLDLDNLSSTLGIPMDYLDRVRKELD